MDMRPFDDRTPHFKEKESFVSADDTPIGSIVLEDRDARKSYVKRLFW